MQSQLEKIRDESDPVKHKRCSTQVFFVGETLYCPLCREDVEFHDIYVDRLSKSYVPIPVYRPYDL